MATGFSLSAPRRWDWLESIVGRWRHWRWQRAKALCEACAGYELDAETRRLMRAGHYRAAVFTARRANAKKARKTIAWFRTFSSLLRDESPRLKTRNQACPGPPRRYGESIDAPKGRIRLRLRWSGELLARSPSARRAGRRH